MIRSIRSSSKGFTVRRRSGSGLARWMAGMLTVGVMASAGAQQTLARGVTMSEMGAMRTVSEPTTSSGPVTTTLQATATNSGAAPITGLKVKFVLYDAAGKVVGEAIATRTKPLATGEAWKASVDTSVEFVRFTVMNVDAE